MQAGKWKPATIIVLATAGLWVSTAGAKSTDPAWINAAGTNGAATLSVPAQTNPQPSEQQAANPPTQAAQPAKGDLTPQLAELVRLAKAGVSENVLLAYVQNSPAIEPATPAQIVRLRQAGLSPRVLKALAQHRPTQRRPAAGMGQASFTSPRVLFLPGPPSVPPVVDLADFYDALAPYGRWVYFSGYGWCWQPSVEVGSSSWQPYGDAGGWVWSDCGWYWNSAYPWGWAPFHYGRWWRHASYGWLWQPDLNWGPAWVSWRRGADYAGWAPLPPGSSFGLGIGWTIDGAPVNRNSTFGLPVSAFVFVPYNHLTAESALAYRLPESRVGILFAHSAPANNFTMGWNNRPIDWGVGLQPVQEATDEPIRQVALVDRQNAPDLSQPGILLSSGLRTSGLNASAVAEAAGLSTADQLAEPGTEPTPSGAGDFVPWPPGPGAFFDDTGSAGVPLRRRFNEGLPATTTGSAANSGVASASAGQSTASSAPSSASASSAPVSSGTAAAPTVGNASPSASSTSSAAAGVAAASQGSAAGQTVPTAASAGQGTFGSVVSGGQSSGSSANAFLPVGQQAASGAAPPFGVVGVPITPNDGSHPYLPVGVPLVANDGSHPYLPVGVPLIANNGANPFLPAGVPLVANNGVNPFRPVTGGTAGTAIPSATPNVSVIGQWPSWPSAQSWPSAPSALGNGVPASGAFTGAGARVGGGSGAVGAVGGARGFGGGAALGAVGGGGHR